MKKRVSVKIKLSVVNFALDGSLDLGQQEPEGPGFAAFRVRGRSDIKKSLFAFLILWSLPSW